MGFEKRNFKIEEENKKINEHDFELGKVKRYAFQRIEKLMTERGLKVQDLEEYANYQERINSLDEVRKIRSLRDKVIGVIIKLGRRPNNPNHNPPNREEDKIDNFLDETSDNRYDNWSKQQQQFPN